MKKYYNNNIYKLLEDYNIAHASIIPELFDSICKYYEPFDYDLKDIRDHRDLKDKEIENIIVIDEWKGFDFNDMVDVPMLIDEFASSFIIPVTEEMATKDYVDIGEQVNKKHYYVMKRWVD